MRLVLTLVMVALLTATVKAQSMRKSHRPDAPAQTEEQKKKQRDADKAYKSALEKMPDKKYDPWAKVR